MGANWANWVVGADLSKRSISSFAINRETGECFAREFAGDGKEDCLLECLKGLDGGTEVVCEAGCASYGFARRVREAGVACTVVQPLGSLRYGPRKKTDRSDAETLARTFLAGLYQQVNVPTLKQEATRRIARQRAKAVQDRGDAQRQIWSFMADTDNLTLLPGQGSWDPGRVRALPGLFEGEPADEAVLRGCVDNWLAAQKRIEGYDAVVKRAVRENPRMDQLTAFTGIGPVRAYCIVAEADCLPGHLSPSQYVCTLGLVPTARNSGVRRGQTRKRARYLSTEHYRETARYLLRMPRGCVPCLPTDYLEDMVEHMKCAPDPACPSNVNKLARKLAEAVWGLLREMEGAFPLVC